MRAVTRPLSDFTDDAIDLNDIAGSDGHLFVRDGAGVAGRGIALRVPVSHATELLAAIEHDSTVAEASPVALGTIPFRPGDDAELIVPQVLVRKPTDGAAYVTVIDDADVETALRPQARPHPASAHFEVGGDGAIETYLAAVTEARDAVRSGALTKAVIARPITVRSDVAINVHAVLLRLKASFGSSYRYSVDGLVGASPELLVEVEGSAVRSHPLAGTTPRTGDADTDALLAAELQASTKNQIEHRVVIDVVHDTLLPWASYLDWEPEPSIVTVANVQHLGTRMEGLLSNPRPSVVELAQALSPTPALGGHPREAALELIERTEGFERGRYGGAVGWVDGNGDGTWAVTIRCAEFGDDRMSARLVAGGGIVAESEPLAELAETQAKFQAMLSALIRP